jgi:hypothetical protein
VYENLQSIARNWTERLLIRCLGLAIASLRSIRREAKVQEKEEGVLPMKAAIWFLVGFGLLLMIASNFFGGVFVLLLGLAMIAGGLFLGFRPGGILRKERIIDNWSVLIDEACIENGDS